MEIGQLTTVSDGLVDKLLKGVFGVSNFFNDIYKFNNAKKNYLDKIGTLQYVKTINEFEDTVSLYDFYVPPYLASVKDKESFKVESLSDIKVHKKILISGIVGQGKSILMRHLAISEVLENKKIPLFYELRYLEKGQTIELVIKKMFDEWLQVKSQKIIDFMLSTGQVTLFFDGFDEIHIADMPKIVIGLESLARKYPKLNFIVSSRPEATIEASVIFQNFQIQKLDFSAQKNIIRALIQNIKMQNAVIEGIEKSTFEIRDALITPLMINLFVYIYKREQIIPEHVKDFYDRLFDLVLRKHDNTKIDFKRERATKLNNNELKKVLQLISYMCCKKQRFAFDENILRNVVQKAIDINVLECSVDQLVFDLTNVLCFIVKEGYLYAFIHKSIPEYFSAEFIRDHGNFLKFYDDIYKGYSRYSNVCIFLSLIDEYNYNMYFLKRIFDRDMIKLKSKDFIDRAYILIDKDKSILRILFNENIHDYFKNEILSSIDKPAKQDVVKSFKDVDSLEIMLSNRRDQEFLSEEIEKEDGVFKDYYDSISSNIDYYSSSSKDLEKELVELGYRKITSVNLKNKFSNTLIFLNSYVSDLEKRYTKIEKIISTYHVDDYSF